MGAMLSLLYQGKKHRAHGALLRTYHYDGDFA